jgi:hypothetical protein
MKKKNIVVVLSLVLSSIVFVQPAANAECTAADPCGVWSVVDSSGTISNNIVCQSSVCGSGRLGDLVVVPQVAANPITNDTTARGGSWGTYDAPTETFTIDRSGPGSNIETQSETDASGVTISVESQRAGYQFKYSDTVQPTYELDRSYERFVPLPENTRATVSGSMTYLDEEEKEQKYSESYIFDKRETAEEVNVVLVREKMRLLMDNIDRILSKLSKWLK